MLNFRVYHDNWQAKIPDVLLPCCVLPCQNTECPVFFFGWSVSSRYSKYTLTNPAAMTSQNIICTVFLLFKPKTYYVPIFWWNREECFVKPKHNMSSFCQIKTHYVKFWPNQNTICPVYVKPQHNMSSFCQTKIQHVQFLVEPGCFVTIAPIISLITRPWCKNICLQYHQHRPSEKLIVCKLGDSTMGEVKFSKW